MTTISFESQGDFLVGFSMEGHTGFAPQGEDILCAATTSAVRLIECAVNDVLGLGASVKVQEDNASISLKLPGGLSEETNQICQTLLHSMMVYFVQLSEEYPDNIIVLEV